MTDQTAKNDLISNPESTSFLTLLIHFPSNMVSSIRAWRKSHDTRVRDRKAIEKLQSLNEHNLRDIGISKDDLRWAETLSAEDAPTRQLQKIARAKRL